MRNLTELILDRAERRPDTRFGMIDSPLTLTAAVDAGCQAAAGFALAGVEPGRRVALIGGTSNRWLMAWLGLVFAGAEPALINPTYPHDLLAEMLADLEPGVVVWPDRPPETAAELAPGAIHIDATGVDRGELLLDHRPVTAAASSPSADALPGLGRDPLDVAGFMHTSGTTGVPKFCEQTHEYFLRLGRFVADAMCITETDTVFAPLQLFHINPLGYGVVGGLTGGADILGTSRFSARDFWPSVRDAQVTVLFLHGPPLEILKRSTSAGDAAGHRINRVFFADSDFLDTFGVPLAYSAYGSTEAGGLSHIWPWRRGNHADLAEGMTRYAGRPRHDLEWTLLDDDEIAVRGRRPGVLFSGYRHRDGLTRPFDHDGWFHTGDLGRIDTHGNLVFIERRTESVRVKGEYVPIGYVEQRFSTLAGLSDLAIWRRTSDLVDDEVVLYVVPDPAGTVPLDNIRATAESLPPFMRPTCVAVVPRLPRDAGIGKIQRRLLDIHNALDIMTL